MNTRAMRKSGLACVGAVLGLAGSSMGQCTAGWAAGVVGTNGPVLALLKLPSGEVVAGGQYTITGVSSRSIARYSPVSNSWTAFGTGVAGGAQAAGALAMLPSGEMLVGGSFSSVDGVSATSVARYNFGTGAFSPLGTGVGYDVYSLGVMDNGDVMAGGAFPSGYFLEMYQPSTGSWVPPVPGGGGPGGPVPLVNATLVLAGGDVMMGGRFTSPSELATNLMIFRAATRTWGTVGSSVGGQVYALAQIPGGDVLVGGAIAGGIARYSLATGTFSAVGAGVTGAPAGGMVNVASLLVIPGGDVIVGGSFNTAGGVPANNIARLNPSTNVWSALGAGVSGGSVPRVNALSLLPSGDLMVGGLFTSAGGNAASNLARYSFGRACPADYNCSGAVTVQDIFNFLNGWFAGDVQADFDGANGLQVADIFAFLNAWFAGC